MANFVNGTLTTHTWRIRNIRFACEMPLMSVISQASSPSTDFNSATRHPMYTNPTTSHFPGRPPLSGCTSCRLCLFATFSGHLASCISILLVFYDNLSGDLPATGRVLAVGVWARGLAPPSAKLNGNLKRRHPKRMQRIFARRLAKL